MGKKIISKKQQSILTLILSFRFINSKQIQKFLDHKDHRGVNRWLKDLTEREYLEKDYKPIFGILTKPAVFNLASKGRRFLRNTYPNLSQKYLERIRDDDDRSKAFRIKCQLIADCYLILFTNPKELIKNLELILKDGVKFQLSIHQFFTPAFYKDLEFVLLPRLKPDAYVYYRSKSGITHTCFFVLDAYVPRVMLQYFLKNIFNTLNDESWEDDSVSSLQLYIICPNNMVIVYLRRLLKSFLESYYGNREIVFHFATRNQLYNRQKYKTKTGWITISSKDY